MRKRPQVNWSPDRERELKKKISNYNKRIASAAKKVDKKFLPDKISYKDVREKIKYSDELRLLTNRMERARYKSLTTIKHGESEYVRGERKRELDRRKREGKIVNKKRLLPNQKVIDPKIISAMKKIRTSTTTSRLPTDMDFLIRSLGLTGDPEADIAKLEEWLNDQNMERSQRWKENYIKRLTDIMADVPEAGNEILALIQKVNNISVRDYLIGQLSDPGNLAIRSLYWESYDQLIEFLDRIDKSWDLIV